MQSCWWATSRGTPSCGSPLPVRRRPRSAWPSTADGRTARPRNGKRPLVLRRRVLARHGGERGREPRQGLTVIVTGRLEQRSWETPDGDKRSKVEVVADEIGPSLRWATAQVTKNERTRSGEGGRAAGRRPRLARRRRRRRRAARIRRGAFLMARSTDRERQQPGAHRKDTGAEQRRRPAILCRDRSTGRLQGRRTCCAKFMSDRGKIRARRVSGNAQQQRDVAKAIKLPASWRCCPTPSAR